MLPRTQVTTNTATKRDTESCGQPKGHKPTGELAEVTSRPGAAGGIGAPLGGQGTPPSHDDVAGDASYTILT